MPRRPLHVPALLRDRYLSPQEAAAACSINHHTFEAALRKGLVASIRWPFPDSPRYVPLSEVERILAAAGVSPTERAVTS